MGITAIVRAIASNKLNISPVTLYWPNPNTVPRAKPIAPGAVKNPAPKVDLGVAQSAIAPPPTWKAAEPIPAKIIANLG